MKYSTSRYTTTPRSSATAETQRVASRREKRVRRATHELQDRLRNLCMARKEGRKSVIDALREIQNVSNCESIEYPLVII